MQPQPCSFAGNNAHSALVNYLNNLLTVTSGPKALPYPEGVKWTVRDHLIALDHRYPTLGIKNRDYHHNDGRTTHLLAAEGTVPIHYQNNSYNIPVSLWLDEHYPRSPPVCYVNPTSNMLVKPDHAYVNSSGVIQVPYLREWSAERSTICNLVDVICSVFSQDPPLFARTVGPPPTQHPHPHPHPHPHAQPHAHAHARPQPGPLSSYPPQHVQHPQQPQQSTYPPSAHNRVPPPQSAYPANAEPLSQPSHAPTRDTAGSAQGYSNLMEMSHSRRMEVVEAAFRERALTSLTPRLSEKMALLESTAMDKIQTKHTALKARHETLRRYRAELGKERENVGQRVETLRAASVALSEWLSENLDSNPALLERIPALAVDSGAELTTADRYELADQAFVSRDPLGAQALDAAAEDAAIEDTLYALERALEAGTLKADVYLKHVRAMCRQQFMSRALVLAIAAKRITQPNNRVR